MSKTDKQLKHITKVAIVMGDQLKKEFLDKKETCKAVTAIKAYDLAIKAIAVKKYKS
jgi:hypothetical protein